jgi:hypothetical protein
VPQDNKKSEAKKRHITKVGAAGKERKGKERKGKERKG